MVRVARWVILLLVLPVFGCAHPSGVSLTSAPPSSRVTTQNPYVFDPLAMDVEQNTFGSRIETTAPTRITAAEAVRVVSARWSQDASPTFVTTREVVYSGYGVRDRIVWLVGAAPVEMHRHGGPAPVGNNTTKAARDPVSGRACYVVDANSGKVLSSGGSSLP